MQRFKWTKAYWWPIKQELGKIALETLAFGRRVKGLEEDLYGAQILPVCIILRGWQ